MNSIILTGKHSARRMPAPKAVKTSPFGQFLECTMLSILVIMMSFCSGVQPIIIIRKTFFLVINILNIPFFIVFYLLKHRNIAIISAFADSTFCNHFADFTAFFTKMAAGSEFTFTNIFIKFFK